MAADIAEILDKLEFDDATYIFKILDSEKTAEILLELDEDLRENILSRLSSKEIAPLLNISVRSVEIKRYRLRKKMDLPHEQGLVEYILTV